MLVEFLLSCIVFALAVILGRMNRLIHLAQMREDRIEMREDRRRQNEIRTENNLKFPLLGD